MQEEIIIILFIILFFDVKFLLNSKMPRSMLNDFGLYFITDSRLTKKTVFDDVKSAIKGGVKIVQYREKGASTKKMIKEAGQISEICRKNNVIFIINDRVDVALAVGADGVHLGQNDMPYLNARRILGSKKIIGISGESAEQALHNEKIGADYTGIGPIFPTSTKKDLPPPIGLGQIRRLKKEIRIPFVAIGGVSRANFGKVLDAGARNIALISGIVAQDDVEKAVRYYIKRINNSKKPSS